jgi:CheY-like chemotaxis protein
VFLNLIINAEQAINAANRAGRLTVRSERINDRIRISISDNGIGIPKENLGKLFDPFFTTKGDNGGTGLGLSISYGIIKEHGGTIKVKSTPGSGATFIVDFPVVASETMKKGADDPVIIPPEKINNARILVVDDEVNICRVLNRILTQEGHEVDTAFNAEMGLQRMKTKSYDLVLLDIKMPGMSGIALYQQMKEIDPSLPHKVIFITGDIISPKNKSFLEESRAPFVSKPFTSDTLMRQVKSALGGQYKDA